MAACGDWCFERRSPQSSSKRRVLVRGFSSATEPETAVVCATRGKTDVVLRLLRGTPVDVVARETQVPAHELDAWRRAQQASTERGLALVFGIRVRKATFPGQIFS